MPLSDRTFPWAVGVCVVCLCGSILYVADVLSPGQTERGSAAARAGAGKKSRPRAPEAQGVASESESARLPAPAVPASERAAPAAAKVDRGWIPVTARDVIDRDSLLVEATRRPAHCALRASVVDQGKRLTSVPESIVRTATRISDEAERDLAEKLRPHILKGIARQGLSLSHVTAAPTERYLNVLLRNLLASTEHRNLPYRIELLQGEMVNAFATPGGSLFFTENMVARLQTEAEVVAVIAHEVGHVERRHPVFAYQLARHVSEDDLAMAAAKLLTMPISAEHEREADDWSTRTIAKASYDPLAGARFWAREAALEAGGQGRPQPTKAKDQLGALVEQALEVADEVFESHPPSSDRCARAFDAGERALKASQQSLYYRGTENLRLREAGPQRAR